MLSYVLLEEECNGVGAVDVSVVRECVFCDTIIPSDSIVGIVGASES